MYRIALFLPNIELRSRPRTISKRELLVKQVVDQAAKGEPKAFPRFFRLMAEIDRERKSGLTARC